MPGHKLNSKYFKVIPCRRGCGTEVTVAMHPVLMQHFAYQEFYGICTHCFTPEEEAYLASQGGQELKRIFQLHLPDFFNH